MTAKATGGSLLSLVALLLLSTAALGQEPGQWQRHVVDDVFGGPDGTRLADIDAGGGVGVHVRLHAPAQAAMRHSSIDLTMNVYTDPRLLDVAGAMEALPDLPLDRGRDAQELRKTGTMGGPGGPEITYDRPTGGKRRKPLKTEALVNLRQRQTRADPLGVAGLEPATSSL